MGQKLLHPTSVYVKIEEGQECMMKKGQILEGVIDRVEFPNRGMIRVLTESQDVMVKNGIPGQKVRFQIHKKKNGKAEGRILEVLESSPLELRKPVCSIFPQCGGLSLIHI